MARLRRERLLLVACGLLGLSRGLHVLTPPDETDLSPPDTSDPAGPDDRIEPCDLANEAPAVKRCPPRKQPLVIVAGEGKTGTESLATSLAMLGLKVAHFDSFIQCCTLVYSNKSVDNTSLLGIDTGLPGEGAYPVCETTPRYSGETCNDVSWDISYGPYYDIVKKLNGMPLEEYDAFDWCQFDDYDVISDVPINDLMPYIYGAYGRGTRVIQTVRNVTEWPSRRAEWDSTEHLNDTAPMGWLFQKDFNEGSLASEPTSASGIYSRSHTAAAFAYAAERSLTRCVVHPDDYLEIDLLSKKFKPRALWAKLAAFLGLDTSGLDTSNFPHEVPGTCHSMNTRATYKLLSSNDTYDPQGARRPYKYTHYNMFNAVPRSFAFLTNLQGCRSTGPDGEPINASQLILGTPWEKIFARNAEELQGLMATNSVLSGSCASSSRADYCQMLASAVEAQAISDLSFSWTGDYQDTQPLLAPGMSSGAGADLLEAVQNTEGLKVAAEELSMALRDIIQAAYKYGLYVHNESDGTTRNMPGLIPKMHHHPEANHTFTA